MYTNNLFKDRTNTQLVDRLIGRSYEVVKEVYLNLPILKELHENDAITFMYEHWDQIADLNANISSIQAVGENIDSILAVPDLLKEVQDAHSEAVTEINNLYRNSVAVLNNLGFSAVNNIKQNTQAGLTQIGTETSNSLAAITDAKENLISDLENTAENIADAWETQVEETTQEHLAELAEEASKAMFSYRYYSLAEPLPYQDLLLTDVYPQTNLKVGDHIVDPEGGIYEVTSVSGSGFQVGKQVTSIKGAKGDTGLPGVGLNLQGVYKTKEEFLAAGIEGKQGDAYQVYDPENPSFQTVMIWNVNTGEWQDGGAIQGAAGESANEILMDPDPEEHFRKVYGTSTGDIIGALSINLEGLVIQPDPVNTFTNNI